MKYLIVSCLLFVSLNISAQDCTEASILQKLKLPRSAPQFFVVNISGNEKEPVAAKVLTDLMKDFDFLALKNMLGK